jgi:hypothetical protein
MSRFLYGAYHVIRAEKQSKRVFCSFQHFSVELVTNSIVLYIDQSGKNYTSKCSPDHALLADI